jgi:hypothetical protein
MLPPFLGGAKPPPPPVDTPETAQLRALILQFLQAAELPPLMGSGCESLLRTLSGEQLVQFADALRDFSRALDRARTSHVAA